MPASEYAAVIPRFVTAILAGRAPTIYGDGQQTRDFTFIENVVDANLKSAEAPLEACGEAYNIACGARISLLDLCGAINRLAGTAVTPDHAERRAGDIQHSLAEIGKARQRLGYEPRVSLEEGLRRTIEHLSAAAGA